MKAKISSIPSTGQVLVSLLKCFGECQEKGVSKPPQNAPRRNKLKEESQSAQYKRIERLAKQLSQAKAVSIAMENALIDAVAALFYPSSKSFHESNNMRNLSLQSRIQKLHRPPEATAIATPVTLGVVFWIVYFIEHHEWLRPRLETAHSKSALWEWTQHVAHFYSNKCADHIRTNPHLFVSLPEDPSWNMPKKQNGTVKWPLCHAIEWLETLLTPEACKQLPGILYQNPDKLNSARSFAKLKRGNHLPRLENIKRWAEYPLEISKHNPLG